MGNEWQSLYISAPTMAQVIPSSDFILIYFLWRKFAILWTKNSPKQTMLKGEISLKSTDFEGKKVLKLSTFLEDFGQIFLAFLFWNHHI